MMAAFAEIRLGVVSQKTRHQRNSRARMFSERRHADDLNRLSEVASETVSHVILPMLRATAFIWDSGE